MRCWNSSCPDNCNCLLILKRLLSNGEDRRKEHESDDVGFNDVDSDDVDSDVDSGDVDFDAMVEELFGEGSDQDELDERNLIDDYRSAGKSNPVHRLELH